MMTTTFLNTFTMSYTIKDFNSIEEYESFKLESWNRYCKASESNNKNPIVSRHSRI